VSPVDYERAVLDALTSFARERRPAPVTAAEVAERAGIAEQMAEITLRKLRAMRAVREHRIRGRQTWEPATAGASHDQRSTP